MKYILILLTVFEGFAFASKMPVYDCSKDITRQTENGYEFIKENWQEYERRLVEAGAVNLRCVRDLVFGRGSVSCDYNDCPLPGFVGWAVPGRPDVYFCPWYVDERLQDVRGEINRSSCLMSKGMDLMALACKMREGEINTYGKIAFELYKELNDGISIISFDCGHNSLKPFQSNEKVLLP